MQNGETALHVAYKWGSSRVQQLLYQNGADDTMKNNVSNCNYNIIIRIYEIIGWKKTSRSGIHEV